MDAIVGARLAKNLLKALKMIKNQSKMWTDGDTVFWCTCDYFLTFLTNSSDLLPLASSKDELQIKL